MPSCICTVLDISLNTNNTNNNNLSSGERRLSEQVRRNAMLINYYYVRSTEMFCGRFCSPSSVTKEKVENNSLQRVKQTKKEKYKKDTDNY